jgi:hypothetical protein
VSGWKIPIKPFHNRSESPLLVHALNKTTSVKEISVAGKQATRQTLVCNGHLPRHNVPKECSRPNAENITENSNAKQLL